MKLISILVASVVAMLAITTAASGTVTPIPSGAYDEFPCKKDINGVALQSDGEGDTFIGTPRRDRLKGGGGDDTIRGLAAGDCIGGNSGQDTLKGGRGDDRIASGKGADLVNCGLGRDRAIVSRDDVVRNCEITIRG